MQAVWTAKHRYQTWIQPANWSHYTAKKKTIDKKYCFTFLGDRWSEECWIYLSVQASISASFPRTWKLNQTLLRSEKYGERIREQHFCKTVQQREKQWKNSKHLTYVICVAMCMPCNWVTWEGRRLTGAGQLEVRSLGSDHKLNWALINKHLLFWIHMTKGALNIVLWHHEEPIMMMGMKMMWCSLKQVNRMKGEGWHKTRVSPFRSRMHDY